MSIKVFKCYIYDCQKIDAEARVLKLEKEYGNAKNVVFQLKQFPMKSVGDIKRTRDAENKLGKIAKELDVARNKVLEINKSQYQSEQDSQVNVRERQPVMSARDRRSMKSLRNSISSRKR